VSKIQVFLVFVALLMSTPGVYSSVSVLSEMFSPFTRCASFSCFFPCLRAANDLKVGRAMARQLAMKPMVEEMEGW
jgi:hypothetical protein